MEKKKKVNFAIWGEGVWSWLWYGFPLKQA
jgi:hypothetical protein